MSLRLDSAETGREYLPQPPLANVVATGSTELSGVAETDDTIPEDFWKPVEISACALRRTPWPIPLSRVPVPLY